MKSGGVGGGFYTCVRSRSADSMCGASIPAAASMSADFPDPGNALHSQLDDPWRRRVSGVCAQHCIADAAFHPVILNRDYCPRLGSRRLESDLVDGLHGIEVDDANRDAIRGEIVRGLKRLVDRNPPPPQLWRRRRQMIAARAIRQSGTPRLANTGRASPRASFGCRRYRASPPFAL